MTRDRFVLSNGHASALLYTMLHLTGYHVSMDDLKRFRQIQSNTPGIEVSYVLKSPGVEIYITHRPPRKFYDSWC